MSWTQSPTWPDTRNYKDSAIAEGSTIAESFARLERRSGRGTLGLRFNRSVYDIETRTYEYQRGAVYRQVVALARAS